MRDHYEVKGRLNKLKVGQRVRAKPSLVDWFSSHLCFSYSRCLPSDEGYNKGEREIAVEDLDMIYVWSRAKLSGKMPTGVVSHYGGEDLNEDGKEYANRKCVWVDFTFRTELGYIKDGTYVSERDLELVKKK